MIKIRVPSAQHLARNWRDTPAMTQKVLVALAKNPPIFNYNALYSALRDLLVLNVPYEQVEKSLARIPREDLRNNFLEVLPLIQNYFQEIKPDFIQSMDRAYYPAGKGLLIPFEPPFIYGVNGQIFFPWFSFWRSNPLSGKRLSLFVTIVEEMLLQDPDMETAKFHILDFSCPNPKEDRQLKVIDADDVPRLDHQEKTEMLSTFVEGFLGAQSELSTTPDTRKNKTSKDSHTSNHPTLFSDI